MSAGHNSLSSESALEADGRPCPRVAASGKSHLREQVLAALLTSPTIASAANTVGIGERTVRRWLAQHEFAEAFANARKQILTAALLALQQATTEAVATLRRNLTCGDPSVEVRAAGTILAQALRWEESHVLAERIATLEERARLADRL